MGWYRRTLQICGFFGIFLLSQWVMGGSHVLLVDVSGSMNEAISSKDPRIRINVVQQALQRYLDALPDSSRVLLMSFNEGVLSREAIELDGDDSRARARSWVEGLDEVSRAKGWTYLWTSLAAALEAATEYAEDETEGPVLVRALTDGEDTEEKTTFEEVLSRFPLVDGKSIRGGLVLLGDIELQVAASEGFAVIRDPEFEALFDPVVQWAPTPVIVGRPVTFFDNSDGRFQTYRWTVDGLVAGERKVLERLFETPGTFSVGLEVEGRAGGYGQAVVSVEVSKPEPPTAAFHALVPEDGRFRVGDRIQFVDDSKGPIETWEWAFGDDASSELRHPSYEPKKPGPLRVQLEVEGPHGGTTVTETFEVLDPTPASVRWVGLRGGSIDTPAMLDFGPVPIAHVRNGLVRSRGAPDFQVTLGGLDRLLWAIEGPGAEAFELREVQGVGAAESLSDPVDGPLVEGTYRLSVRTDSDEGLAEAALRLWSPRPGVPSEDRTLYEGPIRLTVVASGAGSPGPILAVFGALAAVAVLALLVRARGKERGARPIKAKRPTPASEPETPSTVPEASIEILPANGSAATAAAGTGAARYRVRQRGRIYFSREDGADRESLVHDLGISGVWLEWNQGRVSLRRSRSRPKKEWVVPGRPFEVANETESHLLKIRLRKDPLDD